MRTAAALAVAVALLPAIAGRAAAGPARGARPADPGVLVFARGTSLWQVPATGEGEPVEIARLGVAATSVTRIDAARDGRTLVIDANGATLVVQRRPGQVTAAWRLQCARRAAIAGAGSRILCPGGDGTATILSLPLPGTAKVHALGAEATAFLGADPATVVAAADDGLWAIEVDGAGRRKRIAPHHPAANLLVSPDGKRAVGSFPDRKGRKVVDEFRLDGEAARRKLVTAGVAVRWSWNSRWLLIEDGRRGCVVRAVGGEYKCWNRFHAAAVAGDGRRIFLQRTIDGRRDLFVAPLAGARPARPHRLVADVPAAVLWMPADAGSADAGSADAGTPASP
jgi:hypothetical protein